MNRPSRLAVAEAIRVLMDQEFPFRIQELGRTEDGSVEVGVLHGHGTAARSYFASYPIVVEGVQVAITVTEAAQIELI